MKTCARCGKTKADEEFNWRWKALGVRQSICKECQSLARHEHYERHTNEEKKRTARKRQDSRDAAQKYIYEYLSDQRCVDCGEYDFSVLTFDHVRGKKKMDIMQMASQGYSIAAIQEEIAKTDVVCFNCHMRREQKRRGSDRFEKFWPKFPEDYEKWKDEDDEE